ncbi:carboxyphosphonoenolpyruvate mutase [Aspergillus sclerotioniger CBS 115572]|uniref:Carboxyphosphonoenolpyruvate mutase n=1 Tax=Aspergillus sclerotioniger CBS 115572 TaxID=1450535 RepID=A0A317WYE1_9EURO|nr:carboxyphosphonoenolpyruvate mutase [Aspergillus sclerotioniger CBS 115572]PWY90352.1 carboxyphosphonoenolpyruvate mutase [Aspergillus sclerotioniger CBS 115572]
MVASPAVARLRQLLADESKIIVCPGVYDGFTARIALAEGFDALYMTGAGTTASRLGQPDLGVVTLNEMRGNAEMIAGLDPAVPLIADADTGFGGSLMVHRTVTEYIRAGVAALHLEDQPTSKRCGHLSNKQLVPEAEYLDRIRAAINARARSGGDIVLIARTDALQSLGYEAAVSRLKGAIALGADVAFLEGVASAEQARQVCEELKPTPVLFNAVPGGVSPDLSVQEAQELGFRLIIYPGLALGAVYQAVREAAQKLKETGTQAVRAGQGPRDIFNVLGLQEAVALDLAAGGRLYDKGV